MQLPLTIVLDSEGSVRDSAAEALRRAGLDVAVTASPHEALDIARTRPVAAAVIGVASGRGAMYDVVDRLGRLRPTAVVAILEGDGETGVQEALRAGIFDVLPRPPHPARLAAFAARAVSQHRLLEELERLRGGETSRATDPLRREDIPMLVRGFVEGLRRLNGLPPIAIAPEALAALESHDWEGSTDDLRQAVETSVILASDGTVRVKDLPSFLRGGAGPEDPGVRADRRFREAKRSVVDAFERTYLTDLLRRHGGNVTAAAGHSGMLRSALQRLLRKHDIRSSSFRGHPWPGVDAS